MKGDGDSTTVRVLGGLLTWGALVAILVLAQSGLAG
jgi:hypothetical protein